MTKLPWMKFFPNDWKGDPCLSRCTPATRGVWIDLLCDIHALGRAGELRGTPEELARSARCSIAEIDNALTELQATGTAEVSARNGIVRILSRRLLREANQRKQWRIQKQNQRCPPTVRDLSGQCPPVDARSQKLYKPPISSLREKKEEQKFHDYSLKEPANWTEKDWQMYEGVYGKEEADRLRKSINEKK